MTSPQGMDELFWGKDHEDVNNWAERLIMAVEVRDLNDDKLFKIAKLNLCGEAKGGLRNSINHSLIGLFQGLQLFKNLVMLMQMKFVSNLM
jgi:hypothetical protein